MFRRLAINDPGGCSYAEVQANFVSIKGIAYLMYRKVSVKGYKIFHLKAFMALVLHRELHGYTTGLESGQGAQPHPYPMGLVVPRGSPQ